MACLEGSQYKQTFGKLDQDTEYKTSQLTCGCPKNDTPKSAGRTLLKVETRSMGNKIGVMVASGSRRDTITAALRAGRKSILIYESSMSIGKLPESDSELLVADVASAEDSEGVEALLELSEEESDCGALRMAGAGTWRKRGRARKRASISVVVGSVGWIELYVTNDTCKDT